MKVLIDGDIFRYRCAFAAERTKYLVELTNANGHKEYKGFDYKKECEEYARRVTEGNNSTFHIWSRKDLQPWENCKQIVQSSLENCLDAIKQRYALEYKDVDYRIWLSGKTNFREAIATTRPYKGNRDDTPKPTYYKDVGAYLVQHWGAVFSEGIEADDSIGIAAMEARATNEDYVLVTNDKDLVQIPGHHYDWITKEFRDISAKEAKFQLFAQILSGDSTDNVPGLEGIGPAKAAEILEGAQSPEEMVTKVVYAYMEARPDDWQEYLEEQWALVYILKDKVTPSFRPEASWLRTKEGQYFLKKYA